MSAPGLQFEKILEQVDENPLSPAVWQQLLHYKNQRKDLFTVKPLAVIISGIEKIFRDGLRDRSGEFLKASTQVMRDVLAKLAKAPNNPTLLCEVGQLYLDHFKYFDLAEAHFKEALRLGGDSPKISSLLQAVNAARQNHEASRTNNVGIVVPAHHNPTPSKLIKQTAKITQRLVLWQKENIDGAGVKPLTSPLPDLDPQQLVAQAMEAVDQNRIDHAYHLCTQAMASSNPHPHLWDAWTHLGTACYEQGNGALAVEAYDKAQKLRPESMISWYNLGVACQLVGDYNRALNCYSTADRLEPNNAKIWCNLGVVYFKLENYSASQRSCERAIKLKPDYARAWDNLAAALGAQDKLDEAISACENAIKAQYDFPEAWLKLGIIHFNRDDYANAQVAFQKASSLESIQSYCRCYLAMIEARQGHVQKAHELCDQVTNVDPEFEILWLAWNELSVAYYHEGKMKEALFAGETAKSLRPDLARVWFNLGLLHQNARQFNEARDCFTQATQIDPNDTIAWHNLGLVCLELGDNDAARQAFSSEHTVTQQLPRRSSVRPDFAVMG